MKHAWLFIILSSLTIFSCQKPYQGDPNISTLSGTWRMVLAIDNASGVVTTRPASIQGNVDITFTPGIAPNGTFAGLTPSNQIWNSDYTTAANQSLTVYNVFMTKFLETTWGADFVNNIRDATSYSFDKNGRLIIKTIGKTLTFIKH